MECTYTPSRCFPLIDHLKRSINFLYRQAHLSLRKQKRKREENTQRLPFLFVRRLQSACRLLLHLHTYPCLKKKLEELDRTRHSTVSLRAFFGVLSTYVYRRKQTIEATSCKKTSVVDHNGQLLYHRGGRMERHSLQPDSFLQICLCTCIQIDRQV